MTATISVSNLSKRYWIGAQRLRSYRTLRESLMEAAHKQGERIQRLFRHGLEPGGNGRDSHPKESFWAVRDVTFEAQPGDVIGIIGRNGAGKSTLLKMLSRITEPTSGRAVLRGRVGSLLEVGTGFHPELTGRENIQLNGAILGMSRREIARRFDEIVTFSQVEQFLDTPVKHYSSGMHVRLAFAVAAHLDTEILIVDEVLAVGDAEFQRRCLNKMSDVTRSGRTVLFVSHNMAAVQHLCNRALYLTRGQIEADGQTDTVIEHYLSSLANGETRSVDLRTHPNRVQGAVAAFEHLQILVEEQEHDVVPMGGGMTIRVGYQLSEPPRNLRVGLVIEDIYGRRVVSFSPTMQCPDLLKRAPSRGAVSCVIPWMNLTEGTYFVTTIISDDQREIDKIDRAAQFQVIKADVLGTGVVPGPQHGILFLESEWSVSWQ